MNQPAATHYETAIRRIFNCARGQHGADADLFKSLLRAEELARDRNTSQAIGLRLNEVKQYLLAAADRLLSGLVSEDAHHPAAEEVERCKAAVAEARGSSDLDLCLQTLTGILDEHWKKDGG